MRNLICRGTESVQPVSAFNKGISTKTSKSSPHLLKVECFFSSIVKTISAAGCIGFVPVSPAPVSPEKCWSGAPARWRATPAACGFRRGRSGRIWCPTPSTRTSSQDGTTPPEEAFIITFSPLVTQEIQSPRLLWGMWFMHDLKMEEKHKCFLLV